MTHIHLSPEQLRGVLIAAQGLHASPSRPATPADVLDTIRRMGTLQIDTISVVNRSPYFVLWSRLGAYDPAWLEQALASGHLFEYWSHAACFLPIEDYPLYRRIMLERTGGLGNSAHWLRDHPAEVALVLEYIRANGGARSADFERTDGVKGTWWNWKDEKLALEYLFDQGELMIARREGFQRVYDLRERILPDWDDTNVPTLEEVTRAFVVKAVKALGATPARWVHDYFRQKKREVAPLLDQLVKEGVLLRGEITSDEPLWHDPIYLHPESLPLVESVVQGVMRPQHTTLLSPFDPLVWDRARAQELFGFDYKIECYTPEPRRIYGYFTLPILYHDRLVGRIDAKAHRKARQFEVKSLHLEPDFTPHEDFIQALIYALRDCADWHNTPEIIIRRSVPADFAGRLTRAGL